MDTKNEIVRHGKQCATITSHFRRKWGLILAPLSLGLLTSFFSKQLFNTFPWLENFVVFLYHHHSSQPLLLPLLTDSSRH